MLNHLFIRELIKNQLFQKIANGYLMYASLFKTMKLRLKYKSKEFLFLSLESGTLLFEIQEQKSMYLEDNNDQNVLFGVSHL